jgi:tetratricopeptide (TPR) repeat protein
MNQGRRIGVLAVVLAIAAPAAVGLWLRPAAGDLEAAGPPIPVREDTEPYRPYKYVLTTEQLIRYYQERAARDPQDSVTPSLLAQTYRRQARETGDFTCYDKADAAAAASLKLHPNYLPARLTRAAVLSARHQFAEALRQAQALYKESGQAEVLYVVGDAQLELGQYAEAERTHRELHDKDVTLPVESRLARLDELKGHTDEALRLMAVAAEEETDVNGNRRSDSWYELRLGEMHWNAGHLEEAARHYEAALALNPDYPMALLFLARVRAAQGRDEEAIRLYGKAVGRYATVPALAELADLHARRGNEFLAKLNYDKIEQAAAVGGGAYDRELALYYADHGRNLPKAVELARRDLKLRQDIYAYDTLAWALCQNGRAAEADKAMTEALKLGTRDATLFYHAGTIAYRLGDKERARGYFGHALAINPYFSTRYAPEARRLLAELGGPDPGTARAAAR